MGKVLLYKQDGHHGRCLEIVFPDSNSMLLPINLKLNRMVEHHIG